METLVSSVITSQNSPIHLPVEADNADRQLYLSAETWPLPYLVDYILQNHHFYITDALPRMMGLLEKVVIEYGLAHPYLEEVFQAFRSLSMHLLSQMRKEEVILFPYITVLAKPKDKAKQIPCWHGTSLTALLQEIEAAHHTIEQNLADIRKLTQNFTIPPQVCNSYDMLFQWLSTFEKAIYQHEYLGNNILFPKAISLEASHSV